VQILQLPIVKCLVVGKILVCQNVQMITKVCNQILKMKTLWKIITVDTSLVAKFQNFRDSFKHLCICLLPMMPLHALTAWLFKLQSHLSYTFTPATVDNY
jgi:hypothetical protein